MLRIEKKAQRSIDIVATVGPNSATESEIERMVDAGVSVFRLNQSHGLHWNHRDYARFVRNASSKFGCQVRLLGDLPGPKIRLGELLHGKYLVSKGQQISLSYKLNNWTTIPFPHPELWLSIEVGHRLVVGDGEIELRVIEKKEDVLVCEALNTGNLRSKKGVNLPETTILKENIVEPDRHHIKFLCELGVDEIAMSFVRSAADIRLLRNYIYEEGADIPIIAKIETAEALNNLEEIAIEADGLMVARGDLALNTCLCEVPFQQRRMIDLGKKLGKPVIIATQMLESMISSPNPTRAEVTDITQAVLDGATGLMLSAETAVGQHPSLAVKKMYEIAHYAYSRRGYHGC